MEGCHGLERVSECLRMCKRAITGQRSGRICVAMPKSSTWAREAMFERMYGSVTQV